jgi:hypothetical protein
MVSVVELIGVPSRVTDHDVPVGRPVSVNVMRYVSGGAAVKVAVIVPSEEMVTVVDAEVDDATVPAELLQELNTSPAQAGATRE